MLPLLLLCSWSCSSADSAVTDEQGQQQCTSKPNCDLGGRNLSSSTIGRSKCCHMCSSTAGCAAAVWLKNGTVETCFLKASAAEVKVLKGGLCFFPKQAPPPPPPTPPPGPGPGPPTGMIYNCTIQGMGQKCTAVGVGGSFANSSCGGGCTLPPPAARQWPPSSPLPTRARAPNILFILSDDLGFK